MRRGTWRPVVAGALAAGAIGLLVACWIAVADQQDFDGAGRRLATVSVAVMGAQVAGWLVGRAPATRSTGLTLQAIGLGFVGVMRLDDLGAMVPVLTVVWATTVLVPGLLIGIGAEPLRAANPALGLRRLRALVGIGVAATSVLGVLVVRSADDGRADPGWWFVDLARATRTAATAGFVALTIVVVLGAAAVAVASVVRLVSAAPSGRRLLTPVLLPLALWGMALTLGQVAALPAIGWIADRDHPFRTELTLPGFWLAQGLPLLTAAAVVAGTTWVELIRPRLDRIDRIVDEDLGPSAVTARLARALADPSVRLWFRDPESDEWLDEMGRVVTPDLDDSERAITVVTRGGQELGLIECDALLLGQPDAIELAITSAGLGIDSTRQAALAERRAARAQALAARLVLAADDARREVLRALAAGPLRTLEECRLRLEAPADGPADQRRDEAMGASLAAAADALQQASEELRRLSHGLYPPELVDGGLRAALTEISSVPARRYAPAVEVTAFLAATGDAQARLTERDGWLTIVLSAPPTDRALSDRVAVLDGTIVGSAIRVPVGG